MNEFMPQRYIIKVIFSVIATILLVKTIQEPNYPIIAYVVMFFVSVYTMASIFGFALRATENYLVAVGLFLIITIGFSLLVSNLENMLPKTLANGIIIVLMLGCCILPIIEVIKGIKYLKGD